jgi:hypothetical protein
MGNNSFIKVILVSFFIFLIIIGATFFIYSKANQYQSGNQIDVEVSNKLSP